MGSALYITHSPCFSCAQLIITAGVMSVHYSYEYRIIDGIKLLRDAGIQVIHHDV